MKDIKNIIFDFGGVIINIDYQRSIQAFIELGIPGFEEKYSQALQMEIFDQLDKGNISPENFLNTMRKMLPKGTSRQQVYDAWNAILLDIPPQRIQLLEKIKDHYKIYLLSNTNALHYPVYTEDLQKSYGYKSLHDLFNGVYLSFELGLRKPDPEIFRLVLNENALNPEETVFIDDSEQNLPPARSLGMKTIFLKQGLDVTELFDNYQLRSKFI